MSDREPLTYGIVAAASVKRDPAVVVQLADTSHVKCSISLPSVVSELGVIAAMNNFPSYVSVDLNGSGSTASSVATAIGPA